MLQLPGAFSDGLAALSYDEGASTLKASHWKGENGPRGERHHRAWRWCVAALALSLAACGELVTPPLTVGMNPWVGYDPLVLARDEGMTDPRQLRVIELSSNAETVRHLRNGLLDAAALTLDETLRLADGGTEVRIVALLDTSLGADVVVAAPRIGSVRQLKGEFIAVEDSTVGLLMLQRMLRKADLTRADVKVVNMDATQHLAALQAGRVGAAVSFAPLSGSMLFAGYRPIFDSSEIPGEILDVLVVRKDVLDERPEAVDALLSAWYGGLNAFQLDTPAAAESLALGTDLSPAAYRAVLAGLRFYSLEASAHELLGSPPPLRVQAENVAAALMEIGLIQRAPRWDELIDGAPLQRLQSRGLTP